MAFGDAPIPKSERPALTLEDPCLYIYTSGTTGLPKAAQHQPLPRLCGDARLLARHGGDRGRRPHLQLPAALSHLGRRARDRRRRCVAGGSVFIREKFSARQFWDDVVDQRLHALPVYRRALPLSPQRAAASEGDAATSIRLCCGNGLRPDIWQTFKERFGIEHIREFYAATEGNAILFNFDDTPGAVGRMPRWARLDLPGDQVSRFDIEQRGAGPRRGRASASNATPDEVGELVSQIVDQPAEAGPALRRLCRQGGDREEDPPRRLRRRRHVVPHRRPDAARRARLLLSSSTGSATPSAGRARTSRPRRWRRLISTCPGVAGGQCLWRRRSPAPRAGPAWRRSSPARASTSPRFAPACPRAISRPMRGRSSSASAARSTATSTFKQRKIDLVPRGLRSRPRSRDPIYFDDAAAGAYVPHRRGALSPHPGGGAPSLTARSLVNPAKRLTMFNFIESASTGAGLSEVVCRPATLS